MKLTLENTPQLAVLNGCECRIWKGTTEKGTEIFAFIALIGAPEDAGEEFAALAEQAVHEVGVVSFTPDGRGRDA